MKLAALAFICFLLHQGVAAALNCTSPTPLSLLSALQRELFPDKNVRPTKKFSNPTNVTVGITVVGIVGVDAKSQTLTTVLWRVLEWDIEGLSWDEQECGTNRISIPREKLWVPDIIISETMDEEKSPHTPYVYLYNTGRVYDDKPVRVVTSCKLTIYTFPFDVQNCSLTFESYIQFATDIRLVEAATAESILMESKKVLETNGEWALSNITIGPSTLALAEGSYSQVKFYIILTRRPILYVVNLIIPSSFLVTLDLFSFMLPPESVDRSAFKMTLILGYTVFLLIMNDLLPATGSQTPLMIVFFSLSLALMVASLLETVFITNIQFSSSHIGPVPHWLNVLVLRYLAAIVCLPQRTSAVTVFINPSFRQPAVTSSVTSISLPHLQTVSGDVDTEKPRVGPELEELRTLRRHLTAIRLKVDKHFRGSNTSQEWHMIGIIIDRLLFGLYLIFITVSFTTIITIWTHHSLFSV